MALKAHLDFESASACDLMRAGVARYREDVSTRVWGFCWRMGDGPVLRWMPGYEDPHELIDHVAAGGIVTAHNAAFERSMWNWVIRGNHGLSHWPIMQIEQQDCTMARSQVMTLPASLENVGKVLGIHHEKDLEGSKAMKKLMRPRKINPDGNIVWWSEDEKIGAQLVETTMQYCAQDVLAECDVDNAVPELSEKERRVWVLDQRINERGVKVDVPVAERAAELVNYSKKQANTAMRELTGGNVKAVSQVAQLVKWVNEQGIECEAIKKGTFKEIVFNAEFIERADVAAAINLRKDASKTSTAKYEKMLECVSTGDRLRYLLAYHAASTGRWAGRLVQPQNFPRFDHEDEQESLAVYTLIDLLASDTPIEQVYSIMEVAFGRVLVWLSKALRSVMIAEEGHELYVADFSNIEGRVNAWLAGEQWKVDAFAMYDLGCGEDMYKLTYSTSFNVALDTITKGQRQVGKVQELASGYQGGVGAYISMAEQYDIDLYELAKEVYSGTEPDTWESFRLRYPNAKDKHGLQEFEWTAMKILVVKYREAHPNIQSSWWAYENAAIAATASPGTVYDASDPDFGKSNVRPGAVRFLSDGNFLYCCLPSGRTIQYAKPELEYQKVKRTRKDGTSYNHNQTKLTYEGINSFTKKWQRQSLYGGKACENITQGVARDILVDSMLRVEQYGYPIVLTVHDENVAEVRVGQGSVDEYKRLMETKEAWFADLPISVSASRDKRYVK